MRIVEIEDGLDRDAVERAVGSAASLKGLRCDDGACHVTRSEFEYELVELEGEAGVPVREPGA